MGYQRAKWNSGLTYQQVCETCKRTVVYTDRSLDFRPWYADGFVDCPICGTHLRHNEKYAIQNHPVSYDTPQKETVESIGTSPFCSNCGKKFEEGHRFCPYCGAKRN